MFEFLDQFSGCVPLQECHAHARHDHQGLRSGAWPFARLFGEGSGFVVQGSGFGIQGSGFRVQGLGSRVQGPGFRGQGFRFDC